MNEMDVEQEVVTGEEDVDVGGLLEVYQRCTPVVEGWDRLRANEDVRFTRWAGQSADGKKWDKNLSDKAFPFNGASDARVNLADQVIGDMVVELQEGFWRAVAKVSGVEARDMGKAGYAQKVLQWVKDTKLVRELVDEVELHAQYGCENGLSVVQVTWARELGWKWKTVAVTEVIGYGAALLAQDARMDPEQVDPETAQVIQEQVAGVLTGGEEQEAVGFIQRLYGEYVRKQIPPHFENQAGDLSVAKAKRILKGLREEGSARFPCPYVCRNEPRLRSLRVWDEVFFPPGIGSIQEADVVFVREYVTEVDFKGRAGSDGWRKEWVKAALAFKGRRSAWKEVDSAEAIEGTADVVFSGDAEDPNSELIEVLYAFRKVVDGDGVVGIYYTVLSAFVEEDHGKNELLDYAHGKLPFVLWRREVLRRRVTASRGVPQIVSTWQRAVKVQEDALTDRTSFETMPPILVPALDGVDYTFAPAGQVPVSRFENAPRFMEGPARPAVVAFDLIEMIERRADGYFGRRRADAPPENAMLKKQGMLRRFLLSWSEVFSQMFALLEQYMDPQEFMRITGAKEPLVSGTEEIGKQFDYVLSFDVAELSPDFVKMKLEAIANLALPLDAMGKIDRGKLTALVVRAIDPTYADELIMDSGSASQQLYRRVLEDAMAMWQGNQPEMIENDPTAQAQVQFMEQIIGQNPVYQEGLKKGEGRFFELMQQWMENRKFSVTQEQNKVVGRIGVGPVEGK